MRVLAIFLLLAVPILGQDESFASSFLSGLLDTLDTQVDAKNCPGVCMHALASLICSNVLEEVECPKPSMKCCVDEPLGNDTITTTRKPFTTRYTTTEAEEDEDVTTRPDKYKDSGNIACPGMCVESRYSQYCEAYLASTGLCVSGRQCCVSRDVYGEKRPPDLVVPSEKKQSTKRPTTALTTTPQPKQRPGHKCRGDCITGLFALLCDHVDEDATCPSDGTCCITESSTEQVTRRPTTPRPTTPAPLPRCPGYCLLNLMSAFCERPAVRLHNTQCKLSGSICCDNSRVPPRTTPRPTTTTTTTTPAPHDSRPDCPGSCIVSLLSFTCFRNAEMTDVFKCKKAGTQCCAPKSKVLEAMGISRNDTFPLATTHPHTQAHTPHTYTPQTLPYTTAMTQYEPSYVTTLRTPEKYNKYVCGVKGTSSRAGRVMGGEDGSRGEWCWQVALINSLNQYLCGAALVGTQWVLTAAHCVTNIVRSGDAIYVRVGDHDLTRKYGSPGAQTLRVATTYIHHNHNSQTLDNDIALLKLHGKAELKEGVCLVCLPARGVSHAAGKRCTVTGYGYMGETGPIPLRVREAELPIVNDAECIRKVNAVTEKIFILPASSFCAGGEEGNDACQGDGGGPLVCQDDGFYELVGLVSWGFGCGRRDVPGVYVKVSSFIGWINQIISVNNQ
ncbi:protein masquerade isoform X2 [Danaus plexippus]|uniref:protein masquerade isoform X2 n=1 Tax=Danaus plexippus TaxID=13037 RepID=UPI002AB26EAD|nr:protein masquerade isoform X2 [Danaus plexippus]